MLWDTTLIAGLSIGAGWGLAVGMALRSRIMSGSSQSKLSNPAEAADAGSLEGYIAENEGNTEMKLVLVVRQDLKMGKGKVAAQCCHAAIMAVEKVRRHHKELVEVAEYGRDHGVTISLVRDDSDSITVVGVGPGPSELVDDVAGHLKLL